MEYADGGSLKKYLKENFKKLTWNDKFRLAYQLASAVSCLHDEEIVHRDLHSNNILIRQNNIKLSDFGLSKRIEEASKTQSDLFGIVPYIDPKKFSKRLYSLDKKSDVYSVGVLLWEISNGQPPFYVEGEPYDGSLAVQIIQGLRESAVPDTPADYVKLYTECWDGEPNKRPDIHEVVERLSAMTSQPNISNYQQQNENFDKITDQITNRNIIISNSSESSSYGELSRMIQDFDKMNTSELGSMTSPEKDFNIIVDEINDLILKLINKIEIRLVPREVIDYFSIHNTNSQEFYNWLLNNQNNSNSIFLLGFFNFHGFETSKNNEKAFKLFINASEKNHILSQYSVGNCYLFGHGTTKNEKLAFEYYKKISNYAAGQLIMGDCYFQGMGIKKDFKMAFNWYEIAANNGNISAMYNLGNFFMSGMGVEKDHNKAFELFKKSAEGGHPPGITILGYCYELGIGTNVDKQKAFELYQRSADLGEMVAQYNLADMYENGRGIIKDMDKAIYWYKESAKRGYQNAQNKLQIFLNNKQFINKLK